MREIKFRAWDKKYKKWFDGFLNIEYLLSQNPPGENCNYEYCQYTGLKDKNGKEIYEGDIVKYDRSVLGTNWTKKGYVVSWNPNKARFTMESLNDDVWGMIYRNYEIIGNIYENSELLTPLTESK